MHEERINGNAQDMIIPLQNMSCEEQFCVFDLLLKFQLSTKDRNDMKALAIQLLNKLKEEPLRVEYWSDKNSIAADVRSVINIYLFNQLPKPYSKGNIDEKTITLFNHFESTYYGGGRSACA